MSPKSPTAAKDEQETLFNGNGEAMEDFPRPPSPPKSLNNLPKRDMIVELGGDQKMTVRTTEVTPLASNGGHGGHVTYSDTLVTDPGSGATMTNVCQVKG